MNYKGHLVANFLILSLFLIFHQSYTLLTVPQLLLFFCGFILGSFVLTPDVDIRKGILFYPLRKLSKHRGITHNWFIGYIVILLYILFLFIITTWFIGGIDGVFEFITKIMGYNREIIISISGVLVSNLLHIFLDKIT